MALKKFFKFGNKREKENDEIEGIVLEKEIDEEVKKVENVIELEKNEKKLDNPRPLTDRLATPKKGFFGKLKEMFLGKIIDDDLYEELEDFLLQSDIGIDMTMKLVSSLEKQVSKKKLKTSEEVYGELKELLKEKLTYNNF